MNTTTLIADYKTKYNNTDCIKYITLLENGDHFLSIYAWPYTIASQALRRHLSNKDIFYLALFFLNNGLNPNKLKQFVFGAKTNQDRKDEDNLVRIIENWVTNTTGDYPYYDLSLRKVIKPSQLKNEEIKAIEHENALIKKHQEQVAKFQKQLEADEQKAQRLQRRAEASRKWKQANASPGPAYLYKKRKPQ